jgi:hypothetical protein
MSDWKETEPLHAVLPREAGWESERDSSRAAAQLYWLWVACQGAVVVV